MAKTRRLLTAISFFESNEDEGIASCVPSKQTPESATKRDFPRGKKTDGDIGLTQRAIPKF
ncbi:hypothetical protein N7471_011752 [Penicillium samsonianum]|uniref:uncharacterized protein n=1 Tax=Penicillium samsonianum TaxID=1882272 RepID=UPI002548F557|nr:uncharacterized protein N7471_011752 [Penicillium samsonianum]KAJ6124435.1 hypothetical protein N7471_011752 [Penicillium samsonianum]